MNKIILPLLLLCVFNANASSSSHSSFSSHSSHSSSHSSSTSTFGSSKSLEANHATGSNSVMSKNLDSSTSQNKATNLYKSQTAPTTTITTPTQTNLGNNPTVTHNYYNSSSGSSPWLWFFLGHEMGNSNHTNNNTQNTSQPTALGQETQNNEENPQHHYVLDFFITLFIIGVVFFIIYKYKKIKNYKNNSYDIN